MSVDRKLSDFTSTNTDNQKDEKPAWAPTDNPSSSKPTCNRCGNKVSKDFARVFGNNQNEVYGCTHDNCLSASAVKRGGTLEDCDGNVADGLGGGYHADI